MMCTELLPNHFRSVVSSDAALPLVVFIAYVVACAGVQSRMLRTLFTLLGDLQNPLRIVRGFVRTASVSDVVQCLAVLIFSYLDLSFALGILTFLLFEGYPPKGEREELCGTEIARWAAAASQDDLCGVLAGVEAAVRAQPVHMRPEFAHDLLDHLLTAGHLDLLDGTRGIVEKLAIPVDDRLHALLVDTAFALGHFHEVRSLTAQRAPRTARPWRTALRAARRVGDASAEEEALNGLRSFGGDFSVYTTEEESAALLCRRRLELLFLDAQKKCTTNDDDALSDGPADEEFDPAFEALIQRIIEQERRLNTRARLLRMAKQTR
jgi:hypothetical protein